MHDPRPRAVARQPLVAPEQGVHQRAGKVAWGGMHDHPSRLVDHYQCGILVDNLQRDRFRPGVALLRLRQIDGDLRPHDRAAGRLGGVPVDPHQILCDQLAGGGAAQLGVQGGDDSVEALASQRLVEQMGDAPAGGRG